MVVRDAEPLRRDDVTQPGDADEAVVREVEGVKVSQALQPACRRKLMVTTRYKTDASCIEATPMHLSCSHSLEPCQFLVGGPSGPERGPTHVDKQNEKDPIGPATKHTHRLG